MNNINFQLDHLSDQAIGKLLNLAPWLTPLSAMQITVSNMIHRLGFWEPIAWATGLSIEILGMATLHTSLAFYQHNRHYKDEKNHMPLAVPIGAFTVYLLLVIGIVVLLEMPLDNDLVKAWISLIVKAMLALLSIPAGLVIVSRELHKETLQKLSRKGKSQKQETESQEENGETFQKEERKAAQVSESPAQIYENWRQVPEEIRKQIAGFHHWSKVKETFPYLKDKTCQNWLKNAQALYLDLT